MRRCTAYVAMTDWQAIWVELDVRRWRRGKRCLTDLAQMFAQPFPLRPREECRGAAAKERLFHGGHHGVPCAWERIQIPYQFPSGGGVGERPQRFQVVRGKARVGIE